MPFSVSQKASNSRPPRWTTCVVWLEVVLISTSGACFVPLLDCWWPQKNSRVCGGKWPLQASLAPSPHLRCAWFTVCGNRLIHCCLSAPWAGCHSTPRVSLGILGGIFLCTHAHTYQHTAAQNSLCTASGFWQGNSAAMSFLLCVSMTLAGE